MWFSYCPMDNEFTTHATFQEARKAAQQSLDLYEQDALDDGWDEDVENIRYGKILGKAELSDRYYKDEYTIDEWERLFPYNSGHDSVSTYQLKDDYIPLKALIEDLKDDEAFYKSKGYGLQDLKQMNDGFQEYLSYMRKVIAVETYTGQPWNSLT